ncbi:unnamed protein product [Caenorhabditis brenneri]
MSNGFRPNNNNLAWNMQPRDCSEQILLEARYYILLSMCWKSRDQDEFVSKAMEKYPDLNRDWLKEFFITRGDGRRLGGVPVYLQNRRYRDAVFELDWKIEQNNLRTGKPIHNKGDEWKFFQQGLINHSYLYDEMFYIWKQRESLEEIFKMYPNDWLAFCSETAKLPLHTSTVRKFFDQKHSEARQKDVNPDTGRSFFDMRNNNQHLLMPVQCNPLPPQTPSRVQLVRGPRGLQLIPTDNGSEAHGESNGLGNGVTLSTRKRSAESNDQEYGKRRVVETPETYAYWETDGIDLWKVAEQVTTALMKPFWGAYEFIKPHFDGKPMKKMPESRELYLPSGIPDWEKWSDNQTLEWALNFVTNPKHVDYLKREMFNSAAIEKIVTEKDVYKMVGMDFNLFCLIEKHFNKVLNNFHGV